MANLKGGDKLKAKLKELGNKLNKKRTLRVGFLEGHTYPNGVSVALIAAIQDGGAPSRGIPPRPFFRNMIKKNEDDWPDVVEAELKSNGYDVDAALDVLGQKMEDDLKISISETNSPPLSPRTIEARLRRMSNKKLLKRFKAGKKIPASAVKPLVDTGVLIGAPRHEVKK